MDRMQLHPTYHPKSHADPLVISHGEGVWLYTVDGQVILDGMAGHWNVNVGYGREELAQAAFDQMKKLAFTSNFSGMTNLPSTLLASKLADFAYDGLHTTHFTSGGSESNDTAFKTARYHWKRKGKAGKYKIIARKGAYHGVSMYSTFATGLEKYPEGRDKAVRAELRFPDPSANPYMAFTVMLAAALDGIERRLEAPKPLNNINLYHVDARERRKLGVKELPGSLAEALTELEKDTLLTEALGEVTCEAFMRAKWEEWDQYRLRVSDYEIEQYLETA